MTQKDIFSGECRQLQVLSTHIMRLSAVVDEENRPSYDNTVQRIQECRELLRQKQHSAIVSAVVLSTEETGGRPKFVVTRELLKPLLDLGFNIKACAQMLNVSPSVIHRNMRLLGLNARQYTVILDADLDAAVRDVTHSNPNGIGYRACHGFLLARGIRVTFERVRQSMHRVNPVAVAMRWGNTIQRRIYHSSSPNAVWHMDGHHKLIRYKFIIHGCIDGFSRFITFLHVSDNNRSDTVLRYFENAVELHGLPSRLRIDEGTENVAVANFMNRQQGGGRGSVLVGRSVHNQRIERLWVDVGNVCVDHFNGLFKAMESGNILDIDNRVDMFCLHYTFHQQIQAHLDDFRLYYNNHRLTSVSGRRGNTPNQLIVRGVLARLDEHTTGTRGIVNSMPQAQPQQDVFMSRDINILNRAEAALLAADSPQSQDGLGIDAYLYIRQKVTSLISMRDLPV